jgi:hypothetical protein
MNRIDRLPALEWSDLAQQEIIVTGINLVEQSAVAYQIGKVAVAGLWYDSYTSPPWFWFALARGVTLRDLLDFGKLKDNIPSGARTLINGEHKTAERFARLYGFEDTGARLDQNSIEYKIFRRA